MDCREPTGMSMLISSLIPEELSLGMIGGGGVRIRSSKLFQNVGPPEFLMAWCENALEERRLEWSSMFIAGSSEMFSRLSNGPTVAVRFGEDVAVVGCEWQRFISLSASLSRTCRITSASRRTSLSIGAPSSRRAARMRAKPLVFG